MLAGWLGVTPAAFIAKWTATGLNEKQASQSHFNDLCALLGVSNPTDGDPTGEAYAFEKGARLHGGGDGWADVWKAGHFAWEYKTPGVPLGAAYNKLLQYAAALQNPPLLITSDINQIILRTNWTNEVTETFTIPLAEMDLVRWQRILRNAFTNPEALKPKKTRQQLTTEVASDFSELIRTLKKAGHPLEEAAHFVNRLVFCLFANSAGLLPEGLFAEMVDEARKEPARFQPYCEALFKAMAFPGGLVGYKTVAWFNGALFEDAKALPLNAIQVGVLRRALEQRDWSQVDVAILGTLFEQGLEAPERAKLGAHYTDRGKIMLIVEPVVVRPLLAEWAEVRARMEAMAAALPPLKVRETAAIAKKREAARAAAAAELSAFQARLGAFRVLDPACGSGNFLYVALGALLDIEHQAILETERFSGALAEPVVGPEAVMGIELNPYAAELARVSVWIGYLQWLAEHGYGLPHDPVLSALDQIECRNAVVGDDGVQAAWPVADVVVGNPPFLGDKLMRRRLGESTTARLRAAYKDFVPGGADLVCYWFERTRVAMEKNRVIRAGLVASNSIRGGANRRVIDRIVTEGSIFEAWSDEPWVLSGAAVRVSVICFALSHDSTGLLNGRKVGNINSDLTAGANVAAARPMASNRRVAFNGIQKTGSFEVTGEVARKWLSEPLNPNGRPNSDVVRQWWNGIDVSRRSRDMWIVDFGTQADELVAAEFVSPYAYLAKHVKAGRVGKREVRTNSVWWIFQWPRPVMRLAVAPFQRWIVTPEVSKHRIFVWADRTICPDKNLILIARDDDTTFGILHSRFHEAWALRVGTSLEDRPRYTPTTTFETFPFPDHLTPNIPAVDYAQNPDAIAIAAATRDLVKKRDAWLNPADLVTRVPEVVPGFPDRIVLRFPKDAKRLQARTLTKLYNMRGKPEGAWLDALHAKLDAAVAAAYGWPADISEPEALAALLSLNQSRATHSAGDART